MSCLTAIHWENWNRRSAWRVSWSANWKAVASINGCGEALICLHSYSHSLLIKLWVLQCASSNLNTQSCISSLFQFAFLYLYPAAWFEMHTKVPVLYLNKTFPGKHQSSMVENTKNQARGQSAAQRPVTCCSVSFASLIADTTLQSFHGVKSHYRA